MNKSGGVTFIKAIYGAFLRGKNTIIAEYWPRGGSQKKTLEDNKKQFGRKRGHEQIVPEIPQYDHKAQELSYQEQF